jgi:hypothetical protein
MHISRVTACPVEVRELGLVQEILTARLDGETAVGVNYDDVGVF